jgi:hypothetical protein
MEMPMTLDWQPTVLYREGLVEAPIERAWELMIDYQGYNPTFEGATVTLVDGERGAEGEVVLIQKVDHETGAPARPFFCRTAKLIPPAPGTPAHIVWYLWTDDDELRNFVDFGLRQDERGVVFSISDYTQDRLEGEALARSRDGLASFLPLLIAIFQKHCKENA